MPKQSGGGAGQPLKGKKVFDIAPPGATMASVNSRPVIADTSPKVQDDLSGISAPVSRKPLRASNPADTHKQLMNAKSRVVVQPTGTLNQDIETRAEEPTAPAALVEFDLSSLSEHEHSLRNTVPAIGEDDFPNTGNDILNEAIAKERSGRHDSNEPEREHEGGKDAKWIADAEKHLISENDSAAAAPPDGLVVAEHKPTFRWGFFVIMAVAVLVAVVVIACLVMIALQMGKSQ